MSGHDSPQAPVRPSRSLEAGEQTNAPRLALRRVEAAAALGVSDETFDRYVRPTLPVVRLGSTRVYPLEALERWLVDQAVAPADEIGGPR